jgi:hypothetical protein
VLYRLWALLGKMPTTKWAPVCDTTPGLISIEPKQPPRSPRFLPTRPKRSTLGVDGNVAVMAVTIKDIRVVRAELQQFDAKQTDFAVRFHIAVVDANLRAASEGHDDPIFREGLAMCVEELAACVRNPGRGCGSLRCFFCEATLKARA